MPVPTPSQSREILSNRHTWEGVGTQPRCGVSSCLPDWPGAWAEVRGGSAGMNALLISWELCNERYSSGNLWGSQEKGSEETNFFTRKACIYQKAKASLTSLSHSPISHESQRHSLQAGVQMSPSATGLNCGKEEDSHLWTLLISVQILDIWGFKGFLELQFI